MLSLWPNPAAGRKNVVFMVADDMRLQYGGDRRFANTVQMITPNIDRLARRSTWFDNAVCQLAKCAPSRVSFLTSRRPDTSRFATMDDADWRAYPLRSDYVTLPQQYRAEGYDVAGAGKLFHGWHHSTQDAGKSWDNFLAVPNEDDGGSIAYSRDWSAMPGGSTIRGSEDCTSALRETGGMTTFQKSATKAMKRACAWGAVSPEQEKRRSLPDTDVANYGVQQLEQWSKAGTEFFLGLGYAPWAVQFRPNGGQFDFARSSARTPHGAHV